MAIVLLPQSPPKAPQALGAQSLGWGAMGYRQAAMVAGRADLCPILLTPC